MGKAGRKHGSVMEQGTQNLTGLPLGGAGTCSHEFVWVGSFT